LSTLNHEEPDRVPLFEVGIDSAPVLEKYGGRSMGDLINALKILRFIIGGHKLFGYISNKPYFIKKAVKSALGMFKRIGYDLVSVPCAGLFTKYKFPKWNCYVEEYGKRYKFAKIMSGDKELNIPYYEGGYFDTEDPAAAYEKWGPLDPDHPARRGAYEGAIEAVGDEMIVFPSVLGPFETTWQAFGFNTFVRLLYQKPSFIERVFKDRGDFIVAVAENMMNLGAEGIFMLDDLGHKTGPLLSPIYFRKYIVPELKRLAAKVHSYNGKVILHSDGNLYPILDDIINAGIDALNPWESTANMDIFKAKEDYGEKISLIGNVPVELLSHGTLQDVEDYAKKLIRICAPGGGYIFSATNLTYSVTLPNYEKMIETAKKCGTYPINL
jgi:uroporphyrinogen decarboxylase